MKKIMMTFLCMVTALTVTAQTNFREMSLDQAVAAAKAEKKQVFVDVMTSWCGPCKMMARDVFPQKGLGDFMNAKFVCIKIDAEKGEGPAVAKTYGVDAYPTFLLLDTEKKLVGKSVGMKEAEDFKAEMERLLNPAATPERLKARYEAGERSAELIKTYAVVLKEEAANGGRREYAQKIEGIKKMVLDYFQGLSTADRLKSENLFAFGNSYTSSTEDVTGRFLIDHLGEFAAADQESVKETATKLMGYEEYNLMAGNKEVTPARIATFRDDLKKAGMDKDSKHDASLKLMEAYTGDGEKYMKLCSKQFKQLTQTQQAALMESLGNKFGKADEATKKKAARVIREQLLDMDTNMLYTAVMDLMKLEREEH